MTHFARFFKCFRRPDLCPFGNNNNRIFAGTVLGAFILHCLQFFGILARKTLSDFLDEVTEYQTDKRNLHKAEGGLGLLDYYPSLVNFIVG